MNDHTATAVAGHNAGMWLCDPIKNVLLIYLRPSSRLSSKFNFIPHNIENRRLMRSTHTASRDQHSAPHARPVRTYLTPSTQPPKTMDRRPTIPSTYRT